ncbi:Fc.00g013850.m01.CDS01 [Cosmosporella sp. VM-42]
MTTRAPIEVREHGKDSEGIRQALDIAVPSFYEDPLFAWMFYEFDAAERHQKLWELLKPIFKSAPVAGGFILDAKDWGATMAVTGPGQRYDSFMTILKSGGVPATLKTGLKPAFRVLLEYLEALDKAKAKVLPKGHLYDCYYVLITATRPTHRKQGLLTAMTQRIMGLARKDGKPIWLEATTEYSKRQFTRFGFEVAGEINVGKGKVDKDGMRKKGGEGVTITGMLWRPEGTGRVDENKENKEVVNGAAPRVKECKGKEKASGTLENEGNVVQESKGKGKQNEDES